LFVSVDKSWKGNEFTLVTVKPYVAEAMKGLNCMIPECIHLYGIEAAERWFSNAGLLSRSEMGPHTTVNHLLQRPRNKSACRQRPISDRNELDADSAHHASHTASRQAPPQTPDYTAQNLLASRGHGNDVGSFGSIYQRQHDDDSIATTKTTTEQMDINTTPGVIVQIDPTIKIHQPNTTHDDKSYGPSSAGFNTDSTKRELREERRLDQDLLKEMRQLTRQTNDSDNSAKTTHSTEAKLVEAFAMIEQNENPQGDGTTRPDIHLT
jgi:hypothetical protein